jgi:hypothetical protein
MRPNFASSLDDQQHAFAGLDVLTIIDQLGRHEQRRRLAPDDDLPLC